jgi:hypothetical protein
MVSNACTYPSEQHEYRAIAVAPTAEGVPERLPTNRKADLAPGKSQEPGSLRG